MIDVSKYHGLGNDFIITSYPEIIGMDLSLLAKKICNRNTGIGADGLIVVKRNPLEMIYYNSDGSRAKMCGNGIRCFAQYCFDNDIVSTNKFMVNTLAGERLVTIDSFFPFSVSVNMGTPSFSVDDIPMKINADTFIQQEYEGLTLSSLEMQVTHTCMEVDFLDHNYMISIGEQIQNLPIYPNSTNVNFYRIETRKRIHMQTYERGAGLTLACGTGACATYALLRKLDLIDDEIEVVLPLGSLFLSSNNEEIIMSGPSEGVFEGKYEVLE